MNAQIENIDTDTGAAATFDAPVLQQLVYYDLDMSLTNRIFQRDNLHV